MRLPDALRPTTLLGGVLTSVAAAGLIATGVWLWRSSSDDKDHLVGGCAPFNVYSQYQFRPYGTLRWSAPEPTAPRTPGFSENELITVDGWVKAQSPYAASNTPPWNADVWFHLADDGGWVTYAGVRSAATQPDPEGGFGPGSDPVPLDPDCQGTYRP